MASKRSTSFWLCGSRLPSTAALVALVCVVSVAGLGASAAMIFLYSPLEEAQAAASGVSGAAPAAEGGGAAHLPPAGIRRSRSNLSVSAAAAAAAAAAVPAAARRPAGPPAGQPAGQPVLEPASASESAPASARRGPRRRGGEPRSGGPVSILRALFAPFSPSLSGFRPDALPAAQAAHRATSDALLPAGNESFARALEAARTAPAPLLAAARQNEWGRRLLQRGEKPDADPLRVHPDVGRTCGAAELSGPGRTGGFDCAYFPAPGGGAQCCCRDVRGALEAAEVSMDEREPGCAFPGGRRISLLTALSPRTWAGPMPSCRHEFTCFPSVVVAGVQKAGTTALFGYLLHHPHFLPAAKKELHFFDRNFHRGPAWLLRQMPALPLPPGHAREESLRMQVGGHNMSSNQVEEPPGSGEAGDEVVDDSPKLARNAPSTEGGEGERDEWFRFISTHVTGEATPSYVLGVDTPANMQTHLPHARVVVILRDPVDRAYSELMMKRRRVTTQRKHTSSESLQPVIDAIHACHSRSAAPLAALAWRATLILRSREFRVAQLAAADSYSNASRLLLVAAAVASRAANNTMSHTASRASKSTAEAAELYEEAGALALAGSEHLRLALALLRLPEVPAPAAPSGAWPPPATTLQADVEHAYAPVRASLHRPVDVRGRKRGSEAAVLRHVGEAWNAFVDRLEELPALLAPLGSAPSSAAAAAAAAAARPPVQPSDDDVRESFNALADHALGAAQRLPVVDPDSLAVSGALSASVLLALDRFWGAYAGNVSAICVAQDVTTDPGLAPVHRMGRRVMADLQECLLSAAGVPDPDAPQEPPGRDGRGSSAAGFLGSTALSSLASNIWGSSNGIGRSRRSGASAGQVRGGGGAREPAPGPDDPGLRLARATEGLLARTMASTSGAASGWLGAMFPEIVDSLARVATQALMPAIVGASGLKLERGGASDLLFAEDGKGANGAIGADDGQDPGEAASNKATPLAEGLVEAPLASAAFSDPLRSPHRAAIDERLLRCFVDESVLGRNGASPRYETLPPIDALVRNEIAALRKCSSEGLPRGQARRLLIDQSTPALPASSDAAEGADAGAMALELKKHRRRLHPLGGAETDSGAGSGLQSGVGSSPFLFGLLGGDDQGLLPPGHPDSTSLLNDGPQAGSDKKCWPGGSSSNIAVDHVYRGIYARQLARLHAALGRDRVLVLSDTELRAHPQETVDALCDFLRLPRLDVSAAAAGRAAGVEAALEAAYPNFGLRTGWRLDGDYEPMSAELRSTLAEFYAPYNRALEEYLGRRFHWKGG
jgi:hypothetical protein